MKIKRVTAEELFKIHKETLERNGKPTKSDLTELTRYCQLMEKINSFQIEIDGKETIKTGSTVKGNPLIGMMAEYEKITSNIARRLGLFRVDRTKLKRTQSLNHKKPKGKKEAEEKVNFEEGL